LLAQPVAVRHRVEPTHVDRWLFTPSPARVGGFRPACGHTKGIVLDEGHLSPAEVKIAQRHRVYGPFPIVPVVKHIAHLECAAAYEYQTVLHGDTAGEVLIGTQRVRRLRAGGRQGGRTKEEKQGGAGQEDADGFFHLWTNFAQM
jgi:hypothetical protein